MFLLKDCSSSLPCIPVWPCDSVVRTMGIELLCGIPRMATHREWHSWEEEIFVLSASIFPTVCTENGLRCSSDSGLLEELLEGMWPPVDPQAGPGQLGASFSLPCPWNVHYAPSSHSSRTHSLEWDVWLRPSWTVYWLNPIKASIQTLKILKGQCGGLFTFWLPRTTLSARLKYMVIEWGT